MLLYFAASAQDVPPTSIRHGSTPVPDSLLEMVNTKRPGFIRGFNWGMATRRVNEELHANFWHVYNPFAWSGPTYKPSDWVDPSLSMSQTVAGMRLVVAPAHAYNDDWLARNLPWFKALNDGAVARGQGAMELNFGGTDPLALTEGMGFRFQPEYDVNTSVFTPRVRDTQGAVFGFRTKRLQAPAGAATDKKTPSAPYVVYTDHSRYYLSADSVQNSDSVNVNSNVDGTSNSVVVLEGSWPSNRFVQWSEGAQNMQTAPFNGKRMYLAVNMRRTDVHDTVRDDAVVLRILLHRNDCGNKGAATPTNDQTTPTDGSQNVRTYAHAYDSVANPDGTRIVLPMLLDTVTNNGYRGQISALVPVGRSVGTGGADELVITRRMLPRGNDAHVDATLLAHFTIDNPRDNWRVGAPCDARDSGRLENLDVRVVYEGRSDVAIDWVQVGSENMTWLTQGWYDRFADTVYRQILSHLRAYNRSHGDLGLRVYKWFNRDEGGEQYWEGMRYMHMLFDSNTTTERGFEHDAARYNHIALSDLTWHGSMPFPDVNTIAPYYQQGYNASKQERRIFLDNEWGMQNIDVDSRIDYDVRWGRHNNGSVALPADTLAALYPGANAFASGSWQQRYEWQRYNLMLSPHFLFDHKRPWIANPWVFGQWETNDSTKIPVPQLWRFPTGEEVRLELYSQLILGAKGYALYWGANKSNARRPADYLSSVAGASMGFAFSPSADLLNVSLRSDSVGPDYLTPDNRTGLYQALNQQHPYTVANITRTLGVAPNKLYMGFRSTRMAIKEVFDKTRRAEDTLAQLQLVTWYSKGFRTWAVGDTSALAALIVPDARSIQTRHPYRLDFEPFDSTFVELSLLRNTTRDLRNATRDLDDTTRDAVVLGVLNRRCNPFYYADTAVRTFVSFAEHDDAVRKARSKKGRYAQQGAREIVLRFNYRHPDGRPRTLHIKSIGERTDNALGIVPIDARIPQDGTLRVLCMPGEGRMLWVEPEVYKP